MKRIVATLFFLGMILGMLSLVLPGFINWNKHKDFIVSRLQPYITRQIDVKGDIHFQILPDPVLSMGDVVISGAKEEADDFIHLKALEAKISFEPLLQGKVIVENINLVEPDIVLSVDGAGRANWSGVLSDKFTQKETEDSANIGGFASSVALNQISLTHGKVTFFHEVTGARASAENLNLVIAAPSLLGPYLVKGDMEYSTLR